MQLVDYKECCGCGNCQVICPQNAIEVNYDIRGFLHPIIDEDKCVSCGACEKKCPIINDFGKLKTGFAIKGYYGRFNEDNLVKQSSSGGVASGLASIFLSRENTAVYGSEYSSDYETVLTNRIESVDEIYRFQNSKYIQSVKRDAYKFIKRDLELGKAVLYIGLPCEIAALKLYLNKEYHKLYCVDLVCHGPTSKTFLSEYLKNVSNGKKVKYFNMRYKKDGIWTPYYMHVELENEEVIEEPFWTSDFGALFARFCCDGCMSCKFKGANRYSDITIGDAWGVDSNLVSDNKSGLSSIIINSQKGIELINQSDFLLIDVDVNKIIKGNPNITENRKKHIDYPVVVKNVYSKGIKKTVKIIRSKKNTIRTMVLKMIKRCR